MNQRQSLSFPKPQTFLAPEQSLSASISVAEFMLKDGNCVIPNMFFDKTKFQEFVKNTYNRTDTEINIHKYSPVEQETDLIEAVGSFAIGSDPAALIVNFEIGNIVVIVGHSEQFYFIDLVHGICYVTRTPEYDIAAYIEQYGNSEYTLSYFREQEESEVAVATAAPPTKKAKKSAVPKKTAKSEQEK